MIPAPLAVRLTFPAKVIAPVKSTALAGPALALTVSVPVVNVPPAKVTLLVSAPAPALSTETEVEILLGMEKSKLIVPVASPVAVSLPTPAANVPLSMAKLRTPPLSEIVRSSPVPRVIESVPAASLHR